MDFFEHQDAARRKTWLLVGYFALAVTAMIAGTYLILLAALSGTDDLLRGHGPSWWSPSLLFISAASVLGVVSLGMLYKIWELRGGGEALAISLGGRRLNPDTTELFERRLLNVVEEMALASGVPVPPVYVMDREAGINAFAAGLVPGDAVIGVNRGTLEYLSRDELQGVIAHEFSHILNGDMRLNLRLIGLLHGILLLAIVGYYMLRFGSSSGSSSRSGKKNGGGQIALIGLGIYLLGYTGLFFARLIKAAISRQREFLADAAAVQFTRNPDGIGGALKKIGGVSSGSLLQSPEAESASHMFFGNAIRGLWFPGFATHPPLGERIRRIDPQFDGRFPKVAPVQPLSDRPAAPRPFTPLTKPPELSARGRAGARAMDATAFISAFGSVNASDVAYAQRLIRSFPEELERAVRDTFSARCVILAMLLDQRREIRAAQLEKIQEMLDEPTRQITAKLAPLVAEQGVSGRLPLMELVLSTLRQLSAKQYGEFRETVIELIRADRQVTLFEFSLQRSLLKRLDRHFRQVPPVKVQFTSVESLRPELESLLSALAYVGSHDDQDRLTAFARGATSLGFSSSTMRAASECTVAVLGPTLDKVLQSSPAVKRDLLRAALQVISFDGQVTPSEAELLRALGDSLECPLPPLFAGPMPDDAGAPPADSAQDG